MLAAWCAGGKKQQQMAPKRSRPLPHLRGSAAGSRAPLSGIQPLAGKGNRNEKLKSIGVADAAEGMDVLAVAAAAEAAKDSVDTAEGAAAAKDGQAAAQGVAKDSQDAPEWPAEDAAIDDLSLTNGPMPAAACGIEFATPGAALAPACLDSSELQQTLSTISSHAAAAEQMRAQNSLLQS